MQEPVRTYEEKLAALIRSKVLPVAALDLEAIEHSIGLWQRIPGIDQRDAVKLVSIHNTAFSEYMHVDHHLWVRPEFRRYRKAWKAAGMRQLVEGSRQLDHLHARAWAQKQGYGYVVLLDVSSGPNMSAGHAEQRRAQGAIKGSAHSNPIYFAEDVHWAKLWDLNQVKPGCLTKETLGRRR